MERSTAAICTVAVTAALLVAAPAAQAATPSAPPPVARETCEDPGQTIPDWNAPTEVAVGTTRVQTLELQISTLAACEVSRVTATVVAPRRTFRVTLVRTSTDGGVDHWRSGLRIDPATLRNSDAGVWPTTFAVTGAHRDAVTLANRVLRASRISFNAGPEPVQDQRITYAGQVERASWNSDRYVVDGDRRVEVSYQWDPHEGGDVVVRPLTRADGRYRVSQRYQGPGWYDAEVLATSTTAAAHSRGDEVSTTAR